MNILQVINALTWGGAQTLLLDLCRYLKSQGHSVTVAAFRDGPLGPSFRQAGIQTLLLEERLFDVLGFWQLSHWIRAQQPDLIHTHLFRASFWARLAARRTTHAPVLTSVHGMESAHFQGIEKHTAHWSHCLVFPSHHLKSWYERSIRALPSSRVEIIAPGAPVSAELPPKVPRSPLRIGTLSRLHPVKGIDRLLAALCQLKQQRVPFELLIGGDGKDRPRLEALSRDSGMADCVRFIGPVQHAAAFLGSLDLFCAPSREEAFGINVCEAMERGIPTVATDVGGFREIIENGVSGILLPGEQPEQWAAILRPLLVDQRRRALLGQAGREQILRRYDRHTCDTQYLSLMDRLTGETRSDSSLQIAISSSELGGGERLALALATEFHHRGRNVRVLCTGNPLQQKFSAAGIPVETVSLRAGGIFFGARLLRSTRRLSQWLIHAHLNRAALMAGFLDRWLGQPTIAHVHGLNRSVYYRWCRRLIAVSRSVAEHLQSQGIPADQISVLPNAIPPSAPTSSVAPSPPPWRIGIVAKLHANKGHDWALQAIDEARDRLPPLQILIFGDGPERAALTERWGSGSLKDCLQFFGFQPDMSVYYPTFHLSLLPSLSEGIPLSLLEALSYGIPVVATRIGGIPEIVEDGVNGFLIPPHDRTALQNALYQVLQPAAHARLSEASKNSFQARNPFSQLVHGVDNLYRVVSDPRHA